MPLKRTIPRVTLNCETCGKTVSVWPCLADKTRFCSHQCLWASRVTHGEASGKSKTLEYSSWIAMKKRCTSPSARSYAEYGGRGITVCDRWAESYEAFLADVGRRPSPQHSLGRIDNDLGYFPGNVKWSTPKEQANNKRNNRLYTANGVTLNIREWASHTGILPATILSRLHRGWTVERAVATETKAR